MNPVERSPTFIFETKTTVDRVKKYATMFIGYR